MEWASPENVWNSWRPASCLPDCWCEAPRYGQFILEPSNTWTNLSFIIVGLICLFIAIRYRGNLDRPLMRMPWLTGIWSFALVVTGVGSFFYHATLTFFWQTFDVIGMYLTVTCFLIFDLGRIRGVAWKAKSYIPLYVITNVAFAASIIWVPVVRRYLFGILVGIFVIVLFTTRLAGKSRVVMPYVYAGLMTFAISQLFWILDVNKIWCDPYALVNGHSIWHILNGVALMLLYLAYFFENRGEE